MDHADRHLEQAEQAIKDTAEDAASKTQQWWKGAKSNGQKVWGNARNSGTEAWEDSQELIRKHPGKALGIAFLAGVALTALIVVSNRD